MTTLNEAKDIILRHFAATWDASACPYVQDNETNVNINDPWARIVVRNTAGGQHTLGAKGNRVYRRVGRVLIQIFTANGSGTQLADELAHAARAVFEGETIENVAFNDGVVREIGSDGEWFQMLADISFDYDETK